MTSPFTEDRADTSTAFRPAISLGATATGASAATLMRAEARLAEHALPRPDMESDGEGQEPAFKPSAIPEPERLRIIAEAIEELRPMLQSDGGDLELLAVKGHRVEVRLTGACLSCALAGMTLGHVRRRLMAVLDTPVMVVPIIG